MNCSTPLFSEGNAGGLTPKIAPIIKKNRDKSAQEVYNLIVEMLKNQESFLFGGENSGSRYNASIASLREAILALSEPIVKKLMSPEAYTQLKRLVEENFLSDAGIAAGSVKNDTEPETPYMENNPDMINEDERVKQKLDSIVETYYGTVIKANDYRKQQFGIDLIKAAIIDTDQKIIVRSNVDLNKALCLLKNRYLGNIVSYLHSIDPNFSAESRVFGDDFRKLPGYEQTLNRFYNELKARKQDGSVEDLITEGWKKRLVGQNDLFYDALNSYVNLVYFDDILEDTIGKVIQLSNSGYSGIELDAQFGKYKFSKGDEHKRKGFQNSENRNALNDIAKFSKLVLSTIPIYSSIDGKFLNRYVNIGNFANAITALFTHAHLLGNNYLTLQDAIINYHSNPYYYSEIIFRELSNPKTNIQRALINAGVNRFNINILTSVFKHVFDTSNPSSIKSIETASLKKQFSIDGYSIIDSINGVIDRTMDATYIQIAYSGNSDMVEVSEKKKFTNRKASYNIVNKINATNSSRPQEVRQRLDTRYPLVKADLTIPDSRRKYDSSCQTFSVSIGQNSITGIIKSSMGILDFKPINIKFSNPRMVQIFDPSNTTIDLISKSSIDRLVNGLNLSTDEQMFRDVLQFIDSFLDTKLLSTDGLNKLYLYKVTNITSENYLQELLESSIRAAVVNNLYYRFNDALQEGKYQSILNFEDFLKEEYIPFRNINFKNSEETRDFFLNKLGVPELISVRTSEDWIDQMANVEAIITGEVSKSVTNDINGNKIANNRTSFLGGNLQYYLSKYKQADRLQVIKEIGDFEGTTLLSELIDDNLNINWELFDKLQTDFFSSSKENLNSRPEHHDGESFTIEHIRNVVESAKRLPISDKVKRKTLVLAALLHDIAKPYHNDDHGLDAMKVINKLFKGTASDNLLKLAIRYHMLQANESVNSYRKMLLAAQILGVNQDEFIDLVLALNSADIQRNRSDDTFDLLSGKTVKETMLEEAQLKRAKFEEAKKTLDQGIAATSPLLFTRDSSLVVKTVFNTDAESRLGIKKSVKDMKAAELFYSSIIYNFYGSYLQADLNPKKFGKGKSELYRTLLTQPTTFSDKISFVTYAIDANKVLQAEGKSYNGKTIWQLNTNEILDLYQDTIGTAYVNLFNNVLNDLRTVLEMPNATAEEIDNVLRTTPMEDILINNKVVQEGLLSKAQRMGIELQLDTHYREVKSKVTINGQKVKVVYGKFNELLYYYATDLYANKESLKRRFEAEKVNFVNDLLTSGVSFYTNYRDDSDDVLRGRKGKHTANPVAKIINQLYPKGGEIENLKRNNFERDWIKNNKLILAKKTNGEPIINGAEIALNESVQLNPILEKYFFTDSLLANNLRFELTGSEVAHPDKAKINYSEIVNNRGITLQNHPEYFAHDEDTGGVALTKDSRGNKIPQVIDNFSNLMWVKSQPALQSVYRDILLKIEAVAQGTQLKRNVIIPATLQYEQQNTLNGVPPKMKVAVIKDTGASVFNFRGDNTEIDAHDGSAYIIPFVSILENKALQDQEVGIDKKPIWHSYNPKLMSATLLKFATFTMTNERMRTSLNSSISLYNLFKQMTNMQWSTTNPDGTITWNNSRNAKFDLINTKGFKKNQFDKINFFTDILANKPLYYEENGNHYQILDFGQDERGYYTIEAEVNILGTRRNSEHDIKVYHAFNENSDHFKFRDSLPTPGLHTINSLFELFNTLGGIYSEELVEDENGNKQLQYTDASSYAVVNFMNNISIRVGNNTEDLTQNTYYQPLKEMMIAYAANKSAVKNGIANINSSDAWLGNTTLRYMELDSDGLGIQMDADHEIDEAEMTEFSQVISALEAGGRLHHMSKQVYRTLGELAVKASQTEIETATRYIQAKNAGLSSDKIKSELYDILGRTLINNYKQNENRTDLAAPIITEIKRKFNLSEDHSLDSFKIPFSDSNLYGQVISTFVSNINSKSIKRKYPGSGCVMVPGYNIIQNYKYNGKIKQFDDVLKEAREANFGQPFFREFNSQIENIQDYNRALVQTYLSKIQETKWTEATSSVEDFIPTDIVDVLADGQYLTTINLDDIGTYYAFKGYSPVKVEKDGSLTGDPDGRYAEATRRGLIGRLAGKDISKVANLTFAINVTRPRNLAPARIKWKYTDTVGVSHTINIFDTAPVRHAFLKQNDPSFSLSNNRHKIQRIFDELDRGIYEGHQIFDLENEAAELVISNMYASKFNTKGKSLADILERGPSFFRIGKIKPIHSSNYEMAFTTNNGKHTYISFKTPRIDDANAFKPKNIGWKYTKSVTDRGQESIYATTRDGQVLFKVGQNISRNGIDYIDGQFIDKETGQQMDKTKKYIDKETGQQIIVDNLRINSKGQVVEYKEFISNYKVTELGKNRRPVTYNLYSINSKNIGDTQHHSTRDTVNGQIAKILSDVYEASSYNGIRLNYTMSGSSALRISEVIPKLRMKGSLEKFMDNTLSKYLVNIDPEKTFSIDKNEYDKDLKNFYNEMANEIFASFEKSLTFTASRIPAQTLQSFMQMRAVALTQSSKNIAYVSHWQTWLQGSDYDIDKAYIMGYEFDDNGKYVGWSDLFDYSSIEGLRASEYLPIPDNVIYEKRDDGFDITEQITNIASKSTKAEKIRAYADLLTKLQDVGYKQVKGNKYTYVTWNETISEKVANEILSDLNLHSSTYLSPQKIEKCLKNSVSSSITNIIQNLRNMDQAYSPIEMKTVRDSSKQSPKGNKSDRMTLLNPLTKFLMQEQNMVGKGVIGITAVGEKVFFNLSHYWNEGIKRKDERWIKNLQFSQTFNRIQGRSKGLGSITSVTKTTLANVNFESAEEMRLRFVNLSAIDKELRSKYMITDQDINDKTDRWKLYRDELIEIARQRQDSDVYADDIISQLLSAATD